MDPGLDHLRRHGDVDAGPGLLDFAVTVRGDGPPRRLRDRLAGSPDGPGRYPVAAPDAAARGVVAARRRHPDEVLAGRADRSALNPGSIEPEVALRGADVVRFLTDESDGHRLPPAAVPAADLVVVGDPDPTSVPHPTDDVAAPASQVDRLVAVPSDALTAVGA